MGRARVTVHTGARAMRLKPKWTGEVQLIRCPEGLLATPGQVLVISNGKVEVADEATVRLVFEDARGGKPRGAQPGPRVSPESKSMRVLLAWAPDSLGNWGTHMGTEKIAEICGLEAKAVRGFTSSLISRGLVRGMRHPAEPKKKLFSITPQGMALVRKLRRTGA